MKINWWIVWGLINIFMFTFGMVGYLALQPVNIEPDDFFGTIWLLSFLSSLLETILYLPLLFPI